MKQFMENALVTTLGAIGIGLAGWLYFMLMGGVLSLV